MRLRYIIIFGAAPSLLSIPSSSDRTPPLPSPCASVLSLLLSPPRLLQSVLSFPHRQSPSTSPASFSLATACTTTLTTTSSCTVPIIRHTATVASRPRSARPTVFGSRYIKDNSQSVASVASCTRLLGPTLSQRRPPAALASKPRLYTNPALQVLAGQH